MKKVDYSKIKKLVINIDMVKGFCETGALADVGIKRTIPYQIERLNIARDEENTEIVFVKENHNENSREFNYFPRHCVCGTIECDVVDELKEYEDEAVKIIKKNSLTGMTDEFMKFIDECKNVEEIEIQGCCTDLCVMNFAIPAVNRMNEFDRNVDVVVYEETVETFDAPNHKRDEYNEWAFKFMSGAGVKVKKIGGR